MADLGMTFAELRVVNGKNIIDHTDTKWTRCARRSKRAACVCCQSRRPCSSARFQMRLRSLRTSSRTCSARHSASTISRRLARRAFDIAERAGARVVRVFSYWRTVDPAACFERVASALSELAEAAEKRGLVIGIENEHACNIATGAETAQLLAAVNTRALRVIWDPANALVAGETPYPDGYKQLPITRIVHVHAKDCTVRDHVPVFGPLGEMGVDWRGQIAALARDGYRRRSASRPTGRGRTATNFREASSAAVIYGTWFVMLEFESLHHVAISVSDLARAKHFYGEVLGLEEIAGRNFRSTVRGTASPIVKCI